MPVRAAQPRARRRPRRTPGRAGRGRCGRSRARDRPSGRRRRDETRAQPAERPLVDEPQLGAVVRRSRTGTRRCCSRRRVGRLRRAAGRSSRGGRAAASPRVEGGSQRYLPRRRAAAMRRPVEPGGEVGRPGEVAADGRGCEHLDAGDRAADDVGLRGRAGRPRPRAARASARLGSLDAGPASASPGREPGVGARVAGPRGLGGLLLGLLLAAAGARRRSTSSPTPTWAVKVFSWSGPSSSMTGTRARRARAAAVSSCRLVFQSRPAPSVAALLDQRVEEPVHERGGRVEAAASR